MLSKGIVLASADVITSKITIFDASYGKACVKADQTLQKIQAGSALSYISSIKNDVVHMHDVCLEHVPLELARNNLSFVHALLELTNKSHMYANSCMQTFQLLWDVIAYAPDSISHQAQLMIIAALLLVVGNFDERITLQTHLVEYLLSCTAKDILKESINFSLYQQLAHWVHACLKIHPYKDELYVIQAHVAWLTLHC